MLIIAKFPHRCTQLNKHNHPLTQASQKKLYDRRQLQCIPVGDRSHWLPLNRNRHHHRCVPSWWGISALVQRSMKENVFRCVPNEQCLASAPGLCFCTKLYYMQLRVKSELNSPWILKTKAKTTIRMKGMTNRLAIAITRTHFFVWYYTPPRGMRMLIGTHTY